MHVDLSFRLRGEELPLDHGYALYGAVSRELPEVHQEDNGWGIHPVYGSRIRPGVLGLNDGSRLKIRMPGEEIDRALDLAGSRLDVDGYNLRVGVPEVRPLEPVPTLKSRYVTIKGYMEPEEFQDAVWRQVDELDGVSAGEPELLIGDRRVMEIDGYTIVGFRVLIGDLEPNTSLAIQRSGVGGRRKMGAGIFRPADDLELEGSGSE